MRKALIIILLLFLCSPPPAVRAQENTCVDALITQDIEWLDGFFAGRNNRAGDKVRVFYPPHLGYYQDCSSLASYPSSMVQVLRAPQTRPQQPQPTPTQPKVVQPTQVKTPVNVAPQAPVQPVSPQQLPPTVVAPTAVPQLQSVAPQAPVVSQPTVQADPQSNNSTNNIVGIIAAVILIIWFLSSDQNGRPRGITILRRQQAPQVQTRVGQAQQNTPRQRVVTPSNPGAQQLPAQQPAAPAAPRTNQAQPAQGNPAQPDDPYRVD